MSKISVNKTRWIIYCLEDVARFLNRDFTQEWEALGRQYDRFKGRSGQLTLLDLQAEIREVLQDHPLRGFPPLQLREKFFSVLENASQVGEIARLRKCHGCEAYFVAADTKRKFHNDQCKIDFFNKRPRPGRKEDMRKYMRKQRETERKAGIKGKKTQ